MDNTNQFKNSTYTATGAAITVSCGFQPEVVLITDSTDNDFMALHINGMTAATHAQFTSAPSKIGSAGITLGSDGFTVGTNALLNEGTNVYNYMALGNVCNQVASGTYTGTGAALSVTVGFQPLFILAFNYTDGDTAWAFIQGMTADTACQITTATAQTASNGCTLSSSGFSLGTSAVINETNKVYYYVAVGDIHNQFGISTYSGTGAALNVSAGFMPLLFLTYNQTDGDMVALHMRGMADTTCYKFDTDATGVTSQGVTLTATGVTLGTDTSVNESAKTYVYAMV